MFHHKNICPIIENYNFTFITAKCIVNASYLWWSAEVRKWPVCRRPNSIFSNEKRLSFLTQEVQLDIEQVPTTQGRARNYLFTDELNYSLIILVTSFEIDTWLIKLYITFDLHWLNSLFTVRILLSLKYFQSIIKFQLFTICANTFNIVGIHSVGNISM